jgi:hypothetical protein
LGQTRESQRVGRLGPSDPLFYFCPSCHQKRVLRFGAWVAEEVLAPVPHRQYVFTVPKMLRIHSEKIAAFSGS